MTTVYVLLQTLAYEGSSLLGVYATEEEARVAWEDWREGLMSAYDDECDIREVVMGEPADWH
jgi:hypothetical protein